MKKYQHNNIGLHYIKNKEDKILYFNDYRNFGTFMVDTKENLDKKLKTFGLNILDKKDNTDLFLKLVKKSNKMICEILLNQKIVAGSGNYLRADAFLKSKDISDEDLKNLYNCLRQLAWYNYDEDRGRKLKIIKNKKFFVYNQKKDIYGFDVYKKNINGRTIHYSMVQVKKNENNT